MKYIRFVIFCLIFTSCNYFNVKKTSSEEILKDELYSFNWNDVDEFPTFASCDTSSTKQGRKSCFETTLANHILESLSQEKIVVSQDLNDTIIIEFKLSEKGMISILNMNIEDNTKSVLPNLEEQLLVSIDSLPKIFPAIKRGQQVTTQFKLPIIINSIGKRNNKY